MFKKWFNSRSLILGGCAFIVFYLAVIPLLILLYGSFRSALGGPGAVFTIQNYVLAYSDKEFYPLFWNSFRYALGTSALTFLIGTYLAWLSERTNTPFKKLFIVMALLPYIIPGIMAAIAWIFLLSPRIGLINRTLMNLFGLSSPLFNVYSMSGMVWIESIHNYPLVFLLMSAAFRSMAVSPQGASTEAGSSAGIPSLVGSRFRSCVPLF